MNPQLIYTALFIFYAIGMILVGIYLYKKHQKERDSSESEATNFWCANRSLPFWQMGISLAAGWMMLGWVGLGIQQIYLQGASGLWVLPIPWFILIFLIIFIIPYIRRLRTISLPRAMMHRFGKPCAIFVGICSFFIFVSWMGAELSMAGHLIAPFLKLEPNLCMALFILPILIYMILGGFRAIILTDTIQFVLMSIFMITLTAVAVLLAMDVSQTSGGIIQTLQNTPTQSYGEESIFSLFACGRILPVILLIAYLPGWLFEQDLTLRIFSCKTLKESYKGLLLGGSIHITFTLILPVIIAFCAILIFPGLNETEALGIVPRLIQEGCPLFVQFFMFLGILAVQMSTVDSFANVSAMAITHDIAEPLFQKIRHTVKHTFYLRFLSACTLFIGLIYAFFAESLYSLYTLSSGVLTAAVAIPMILIFFKKAKPLAALLAAILGALGNIAFFIYEYKICENNYQPTWLAETYVGYIVIGIVAALIGAAIGQIFGRKPTDEEVASVADFPHDGVSKMIID